MTLKSSQTVDKVCQQSFLFGIIVVGDKMSMTKSYSKEKGFNVSVFDIDEIVPDNHLVRKLENAIDWSFIYPIVEPLYADFGRPSIDPVILFKMVFINYTFGINSMRRTCEQAQVDMSYRWFLGLDLNDPVPNYSTYSKNYERRYKDSNVFEEIFSYILKVGLDKKLIQPDVTFIDSTHVKANANKRKYVNKAIRQETRYYQGELEREIDEDRAYRGKKPLKKNQLLSSRKKPVRYFKIIEN
jgi:transposase